MATNPNEIVGTNVAYSGRTSAKAFNDVLEIFTGRGVVSGWKIVPKSGLTVTVGGQDGVSDVAVAEDNAGMKTTIDNRTGDPAEVTFAEAPVERQRIDAVVAYVVNPPEGRNGEMDNPSACGLIAVSGNPAQKPKAPTDRQIRAAIVKDGEGGANAFYCVLGTVRIPAGLDTVTETMILPIEYAKIRKELF